MTPNTEERYRQQLRLFEAISATTPDFIYVFDLHGRFVYANRRLLEVWGVTFDQAVGKNLYELGYPKWHADMHMRELAQVIETRQPIKGEVPFTGGSGISGVYEYIFWPIIGPGGEVEVIAGTTRDVSDRRRAEGRDQFLVALDDAMRPLTDPREITLAAARLLGQHLNVDRCAYADVEADQDTMNLTGNYTRDASVRSIVGRLRFADFGAEVLALMRADQPFVVNDVDHHTPPVGDPAAYRATQIQAVICVPLHKGGRFVAAMAVHQLTPRQWTTDEVELLRGVAARCWESIERARAERHLRQSEERLVFALRAGQMGTWELDLATGDMTCSDTSRANYGRGPGEPFGYVEFESSVVEEDRQRWRDVVKAGVAQGGVFEVEYRVRWPDESIHWIMLRAGCVTDERGRVTGLSGVSLDITDRKRAEEPERRAAAEAIAAAEANAKFRTFFEQGSYFAGVMALDGTLIEANRVCLDACGYTRDEVIGRKFWECGWWRPAPDLVEMIRAASQEAAAGRAFRRETRYFVADGDERFVDLSITPVTDAAGRVLFVAPTGTDITDRKRLTDDRERLLEAERAARAEAERAGRMKDEFLATLSHELRTPLNAIMGWAQILRAAGCTPDDVREGVEIIERNARVQTQIIEDLLDMSRIVSGKIRLDVQRVDLAAVVRAAVETVQPAADAKGVRLQTVLDPLSGPVSGDPGRLQQVFWNLLTNAVKFTPRGGRVQVVLERVDSHVEVSVIDTGEGIDPRFLPYVFDRFRQADATTTRRHGGLGLGLALVKQLSELHGGTARVKSGGAGQGSTFTVALPLTVVHPDPEAVEPERRHPGGGSMTMLDETCASIAGVKVLVVDDEPDARNLVRRLLEDCEAVVTTAASAREAWEALAAQRPAIIVSDIGMPGEDGYSLIRRVRTLPPDAGGRTPAIALTAYARPEDRMKAVLAGFDMHVVKPVEPAELITMVASLAARARN